MFISIHLLSTWPNGDSGKIAEYRRWASPGPSKKIKANMKYLHISWVRTTGDKRAYYLTNMNNFYLNIINSI